MEYNRHCFTSSPESIASRDRIDNPRIKVCSSNQPDLPFLELDCSRAQNESGGNRQQTVEDEIDMRRKSNSGELCGRNENTKAKCRSQEDSSILEKTDGSSELRHDAKRREWKSRTRIGG